MAVIFKLACFAWIGGQGLKEEKNSEQSPQAKQVGWGSKHIPLKVFQGDVEGKAHSKNSEAGFINKVSEINAHESRGKKQQWQQQ